MNPSAWPFSFQLTTHTSSCPLTLTDSGAFTAYFGVKRTVESSLVVFSLPTTAALMVYSLVLRS